MPTAPSRRSRSRCASCRDTPTTPRSAWPAVRARSAGDEEAALLREQARLLYERVNDRFWWEEEGTYYLGLDGDKQPIRTVASNAGHLLWSGIVPVERAGRVVERLLAPDMWSGWGIRTLSSDHLGYNPFGYHTGTVWPHDNGIIAAGFRRYGFDHEAAKIAKAIFDAAERFQVNRLPELFAGLPREQGSFPVQYLGRKRATGVGRRCGHPPGGHPGWDRGPLGAGWLADLRQPRPARLAADATAVEPPGGPGSARPGSPGWPR